MACQASAGPGVLLDGRGDGLEMLVLEDARFAGSRGRIIGNGVPRAEYEIFEARKGHELLDVR